MTRRTPEGKVKDKCIEIFKKLGIMYFMPVGSMYGRGGILDFICCIHGRMVAVETKKDRNTKTTKLQDKFINDVRRAGGTCLVIHNENLDVLERLLKAMLLEDEG